MTFYDSFVHDNYAYHLYARHMLLPLLPFKPPSWSSGLETIMPIWPQSPLGLGEGQGFAQGRTALERPRAGISIWVWGTLKESAASLWYMGAVGVYSVFPPQGQSWSPSSSLPGNLVNSLNEPNKCAPWSMGSITPSLLCTGPGLPCTGPASLTWIIPAISPLPHFCSCRGQAEPGVC